MTAWLCALLLWVPFWWAYAAYRLCAPADGTLFHPRDTEATKLVTLVVWVILVLTAPLWCPVYLIIAGEAP